MLGDFEERVPPGTAVLWKDPGYKGEYNYSMNVDTLAELKFPLFKNTIDSFKLGANTRVKFCRRKDCSIHDWTDAFELVGPYNCGKITDGSNFMLSHVSLHRYDPNNEKYVMIFSKERFELGYSGLFAVGQYDSEDIKNNHIDKGGSNLATSSLVIPEGLFVTLFKEDYFKGEQVTI